MTDRLLTDEEMWVESERNSDWDDEQIWEQISQAQDTKTLKAIGEWLEQTIRGARKGGLFLR